MFLKKNSLEEKCCHVLTMIAIGRYQRMHKKTIEKYVFSIFSSRKKDFRLLDISSLFTSDNNRRINAFLGTKKIDTYWKGVVPHVMKAEAK